MSLPVQPFAVYVTYIVSTPEQVWEALTSATFTEQYFFGRKVESDWQVGSAWKLWMPDGRLDCQGTVLENEPLRKLSITWHVEWVEEMRALPETILSYELTDLNGLVRLTVSDYHPTPIPEKYHAGGRRGWPIILSGLKSLLETGRPLPPFDFSK